MGAANCCGCGASVEYGGGSFGKPCCGGGFDGGCCGSSCGGGLGEGCCTSCCGPAGAIGCCGGPYGGSSGGLIGSCLVCCSCCTGVPSYVPPSVLTPAPVTITQFVEGPPVYVDRPVIKEVIT